jgi:iron complex transport system substrate-binding protein
MKRVKCISILLALCMILSFGAGCSGSNGSNDNGNDKAGATTAEGDQTEQTGNAETIVFTDSAGREVEVPAEITRIAPSGSLAQIVLFALAPEMFVGLPNQFSGDAEQFIDPEYFNLPVLGHLYGAKDLNLEEIAKVNPQIIIDVGESRSSVVEDMDTIQEQVKIPAVHIAASTTTMPEAYRTLGKLLGKEEEAEVLASYCDEVYNKMLDIMEDVGEDNKVGVLQLAGEDGLNVIGKGSFHAEILDIISDNLAVLESPTGKGLGDPVDIERIAIWNPEVILFAPGSIYDTVAENPAWKDIDAIKTGRYYEIPGTPNNWMGNPPSVNRYIGILWALKILYPEHAEYDMFEETARYYKLFYHCDLTEEQYEELVANSILK